MFSTCLQSFVSWKHRLWPQRMHPQKHIPCHLPKRKVIVRKNEIWHSYKKFQYINLIYLETWFNFLHLIFFTQSKIFCVSISKKAIKLRDCWFFNFLLHLTCQKWPSLACSHPQPVMFWWRNTLGWSTCVCHKRSSKPIFRHKALHTWKWVYIN